MPKPGKTPREPDSRFAGMSPSRAWREWLKTLTPEERSRLEAAGVNPDEPTRDLRLDVKDGTLDRSSTTGQFVRQESPGSDPALSILEPEPGDTFDRDTVLELFRRFFTVFELFPEDRSLRLFGRVLSVSVGLPNCPSAKEIGEEFGITKQAVTKKINTVAAHLCLPPSFRMDRSSVESLAKIRSQLREEQRKRVARRLKKAALPKSKRKGDLLPGLDLPSLNA